MPALIKLVNSFRVSLFVVNLSNQRVGLCAHCLHMRLVHSSKGSTFYLCQLAQTDPRFLKYPRLPVLECSGYQFAPDKTNPKNSQM